MDAPTVLLIDEDSDSLAIFSLILRHHGFRVLVTQDAETGFTMACEQQPDLVVLEPFFPPIRGRRLTEMLRAEARTAGLRVLLVTAVPSLVEGEISLGDWAEGYLVKPCQPRSFLAEVQRRLEAVLSAA
jgi:DNA-binding response OmpR family regulator